MGRLVEVLHKFSTVLLCSLCITSSGQKSTKWVLLYTFLLDFTFSDIVLMIFILGYIWEQFRMTSKQGLRSYLKDWWLAYTAIMTLCFITSGVARLATIVMSTIEVLPTIHIQLTSLKSPVSQQNMDICIV